MSQSGGGVCLEKMAPSVHSYLAPGGKMIHGRTKSGNSLSSLQGLRSYVHQQTWILVADRSRIRLFEKAKDELGEVLYLREDVCNPDGRKKGRELISDRPGRSFESHNISTHGQSGPVRHSYGEAHLPETQATERLVKLAAEMCVQRRLESQDVTLYVMAEPKLMGLLRPALQKSVPNARLSFEAKDFAWVDNHELEDRLNEMIP